MQRRTVPLGRGEFCKLVSSQTYEVSAQLSVRQIIDGDCVSFETRFDTNIASREDEGPEFAVLIYLVYLFFGVLGDVFGTVSSTPCFPCCYRVSFRRHIDLGQRTAHCSRCLRGT